jgi:hypothetical protein
MTIVLNPTTLADNGCIIGYQNLLELGTVVASSENADYPVENCFDWLTTDYFKPAATGTINIDLTLTSGMPADYFAFYAHTLHTTGCSIKLQYHNGSGYVDATDTITPTTSVPMLYTFDEVTATLWRVVVTTASTVPALGVVCFGKALTLPRGVYIGYSEPLFGRANKFINSVSEGGSFLGRSVIASAVRSTLSLQYASDSWMRDYWLDFVEHAEGKPFFYLWNPRDYPTECAFCWAEGDIPAPTHTHYGYMGTSFTVRGLIE